MKSNYAHNPNHAVALRDVHQSELAVLYLTGLASEDGPPTDMRSTSGGSLGRGHPRKIPLPSEEAPPSTSSQDPQYVCMLYHPNVLGHTMPALN